MTIRADDPLPITYDDDGTLKVYEALEVVACEEARTDRGKAALVRRFERALNERKMIILFVDDATAALAIGHLDERDAAEPQP